jgi:hypothetical protein
MKQIAQLAGTELIMSQANAFKQEYEFRIRDELAATLKFKSSFSSLATAESADGCWTFRRPGFWQITTTILECGTEREAGIYRRNAWKGGGVLDLPYGRSYAMTTNFWQTHCDFRNELDQSFIHYKISGFFRLSTVIQIDTNAANIRELPWIVLLGGYTIVMMRRDSAAAS